MDMFNYLRGKTNKSIQEQLFDQILIVVFCVSIVNIVGNIIISFPLGANVKWVFMIALTMVINRFKNDSIWVRYFFVTFIIMVIVPLGWYNSGANNNNVIAYIFLITVAVSFLFNGFYRLSLVILINLIFITFLYFEFFMPEILVQHNVNLQFFDRLIQIPLIIIATYFMLKQFANTFYDKNQQLNELNSKLEEIAYQDDLTLVNNRTFIFERYQETIKRNRPFITLMIDVDNFKQVNDEFGHLDGDHVLREMGAALKEHFGRHGHIARYGGDEFILLLYLEPDTVDFKLKSFFDYLNSLEIIQKTETTVSGGYDLYQYGQTLDDHLRSVDLTLYKAKNTGKNQILQA